MTRVFKIRCYPTKNSNKKDRAKLWNLQICMEYVFRIYPKRIC
jgi:hypothetical protein